MSTLSTLSIFEGAQDAQEDRKLSNKIMKALKMLKIPTLSTFALEAPELASAPAAGPPHGRGSRRTGAAYLQSCRQDLFRAKPLQLLRMLGARPRWGMPGEAAGEGPANSRWNQVPCPCPWGPQASDPRVGLPGATSRSTGYPYGHIASLCPSEIRAIMPPVGV